MCNVIMPITYDIRAVRHVIILVPITHHRHTSFSRLKEGLRVQLLQSEGFRQSLQAMKP